MQPLVIISGPTATFKSHTAILLAQFLQAHAIPAVIINFDSLLFYRELNIGTAKPSATELALIPHEMVNIASIRNPLNAAQFTEQAQTIIASYHGKNYLPILVGGSAFYLRALIKGMYPATSIATEVTTRVQNLYQSTGISAIIQELQQLDPQILRRLHVNDHYRLQRALEYCYASGKKFSDLQASIPAPFDFSITINPRWRVHHCYLDLPKSFHWQIIQQRTENMLAQGLEQEVRNLLKQGFSGQEKPLQSIGYKEMLVDVTRPSGQVSNPVSNQVSDQISIATRQLAKSQRTFFNKIHPKTTYHPLEQVEQLQQDVLQFFASGEEDK